MTDTHSTTTTTSYTANCLCSGVTFRITGELQPIQVCHCMQCRKAQGTVFATNMPVDRTAFQLDSGAELLTEYESSPGKKRAFCSRCGSPVYSRRDDLPQVLRIRAGLINEPLPVRAAAHFYVADKANWWTIDDTLPQYEQAFKPPV
ncbi:MAG: GFA family protein [Cytophagales bacterium]|nr:GFA family protein [Rhizobacter sp.]